MAIDTLGAAGVTTAAMQSAGASSNPSASAGTGSDAFAGLLGQLSNADATPAGPTPVSSLQQGAGKNPKKAAASGAAGQGDKDKAAATDEPEAAGVKAQAASSPAEDRSQAAASGATSAADGAQQVALMSAAIAQAAGLQASTAQAGVGGQVNTATQPASSPATPGAGGLAKHAVRGPVVAGGAAEAPAASAGGGTVAGHATRSGVAGLVVAGQDAAAADANAGADAAQVMSGPSTLSLNAVTQDAASGREVGRKSLASEGAASVTLPDSLKHLLASEPRKDKSASSDAKGATADSNATLPAVAGAASPTGAPTAVGAGSELAGGNANSGGRSTEESMAEQVSYWIHQKRQGAELTLDGGNGQSVGVSISMSGNEAHVAFHSATEQTREMISGALPELRQLLQGEGVVLAGVTVGDSGAQSGSSGGRGQGGGARSAAPAAVGSLGAGDAAASTTSTQAVSTRSMLDLFV